jgi:uncharacterized protein (DUF4415 family)
MSDNAMSKPSGTDWERLERMADDEIDQSDIPALTSAFFERARVYLPPHMAATMVQVDTDILAWFKAQGKEHQTAINDILRSYIQSVSKSQ